MIEGVEMEQPERRSNLENYQSSQDGKSILTENGLKLTKMEFLKHIYSKCDDNARGVMEATEKTEEVLTQQMENEVTYASKVAFHAPTGNIGMNGQRHHRITEYMERARMANQKEVQRKNCEIDQEDYIR